MFWSPGCRDGVVLKYHREFEYKIGSDGAIDMVQGDGEVTLRHGEVVQYFNRGSFCGKGDWELDTPVKWSELDCGSEGDLMNSGETEYSIFRVKDGQLWLGRSTKLDDDTRTGSTEETRHTEFGPPMNKLENISQVFRTSDL